ncbi:hypothetical protein AB0L68_09520 [Streptomyces sp. NPDC052164]|uniref:hypothetical protein n=1 Tax=Streptomyces sp. NPDC052164 TaxID=3155529 RepID=UPI003419E49C
MRGEDGAPVRAGVVQKAGPRGAPRPRTPKRVVRTALTRSSAALPVGRAAGRSGPGGLRLRPDARP